MAIPVTATDMREWVRLAATAVNELLRRFATLVGRVDAAEADIDVLQTGLSAAQADIVSLQTQAVDHETRIAALEDYSAPSFTFTPTTLPGSPATGQTVFDSGDGKLKTWDGSAWQSHW